MVMRPNLIGHHLAGFIFSVYIMTSTERQRKIDTSGLLTFHRVPNFNFILDFINRQGHLCEIISHFV